MTSIRQRFTIASPTDEPETKSAAFDEFFHFLRPDRMSVYIVDYETSMNENESACVRCPVVGQRRFTAKIGPICTLLIEIYRFAEPIVGQRGNDDLSAVGAKEEK